MAKDDVFLMTYRENGVQLMRGVTLKELFLYWGGDERGSRLRRPAQGFSDLHHHRRARHARRRASPTR